MHRCLQVPEIVCLLSKAVKQRDLFTGKRPKDRDLLSMALTCRTFLEPALDVLWKSIHDLDPIIACLPKDLWMKKTTFHNTGDCDRYPVTTFHLRREMTARDLERYLRFCAPRIRNFCFCADPESADGHRIFSNDAFLALQMATRFVPGALSPSLRSFSEWLPWIVVKFAEWAHPFMSLFLGESVTSLDFDHIELPETPLRKSSIQNAIESLTNLECISIAAGDTEDRVPFLEDAISNSTWLHLKRAFLSIIVSPPAFACLSTLPSLESLTLRGLALKSSSSWPSLDSSSSLAVDATFFPSLKYLQIDLDVASATYIVQRLPLENGLQSLHVMCSGDFDSPMEIQMFMEAVSRRANPCVFEDLLLWLESFSQDHNSQPDLRRSTGTDIDVSSLLALHGLRDLSLHLNTTSILLRPEAAQWIPIAWPNLKRLNLRSTRPTGPSIDRPGLKTILEGCSPMPVFKMQFLGDPTSSDKGSNSDEGTESGPSDEDSELGSDEDSESDPSGEDSEPGSNEDSDVGSNEDSDIAPDDESDAASENEADEGSDQDLGEELQEKDDEAEDATGEHS